MTTSNKNILYCSFCGKSQHEVKKLIAGPTVFICDECVELCMDIIKDETKNVVKKESIRSEKESKDKILGMLDGFKDARKDAFLKYYKNKSGAKLPDDLIRKGLVEEILHGYNIPNASQEWLSALTLAEKERLIIGLEFILADYKRLRDALIQSKVYRLTKKFTK